MPIMPQLIKRKKKRDLDNNLLIKANFKQNLKKENNKNLQDDIAVRFWLGLALGIISLTFSGIFM